ncbi:MAG: hypothetical protein RJB08_1534 [Actinomycetota bacterium]
MAEVVSDCISEVMDCLSIHGHQAGGYHVLSPDPWRLIWNNERDGFVAFLEARHAILAWRSPVARHRDRTELLVRLLEHAKRSKKPLFAVLVDDETHKAGIAHGLLPTWVGIESIVDLTQWSLAGGRRQKVRWARNHAAGLGYQWREVFPLESPADRDALHDVERAWKAERKARGTDSFQRTSFLELAEIRRYFACVLNTDVVAFCACTPMNSTSWYLQDVVRRPDAPRGALEGAMALALDVLRDEGYLMASNGPIPFWQPNDLGPDDHSLGPIGHRIVRFFDQQYRFDGISQFRNKFAADQLEPLYVLRSHRVIGPLAAASLTRLMTRRLAPG